MLSEILQSVTGMGGYTTFGTIIFFITFIMLTVKTIRLDKSYNRYMSNLPIDSSNSEIHEEDI
ncbi:MAG: hypothetical protein P9L92_17885 [Candidatus Electryonea clarkiae]|nr:hypothetical protein [Candidatus Electryonea clarkiae]MDP8287749.1 hypothetical protein [Candidatus Electryonea clarkiae]